MLRKGSSGSIYIHPWDITDEGIDNCFNTLENVCGFNELYISATYHASTFVLPHNPKRIVRWDDGGLYFVPQHPRWRETRLKPVIGDFVDTAGYMHNIVDNARKRNWGINFFVVFHFIHSIAQKNPDACVVDPLGERHRAYLCPGNPDVREYDLAMVEDLMGTYGGDGIRYESVNFARWNYGVMVDKNEIKPSQRDQSLLSLCFCGSCLQRARAEGFDAAPLRMEIRKHLYESLSKPPSERDDGPADEEWARNAFDGKLWKFLDVRCNTVTSLFEEMQALVNFKYGGALMPFGVRMDRSLMNAIDYSKFYPHIKRLVVWGNPNSSLEEAKAGLLKQISGAPKTVEMAGEHHPLSFKSEKHMRDLLMMMREMGVTHHSFFYYGETPDYILEWIGKARDAWA